MDTGLQIEVVMASMALVGLVVSVLTFSASSRKARDERQKERELAAESRGALKQWQQGVDDALVSCRVSLVEVREENERENRFIRKDMDRHHAELQSELRSIHKTLGELRGSLTSLK